MSNESVKNSLHDLNNILTSIANGIELLKYSIPPDDESGRVIKGLENSIKRAYDIVHSHLTPTDSIRKSISRVNVSAIVNEVVDNFTEKEKSLIDVIVDDDSLTVLVDGTDLFRMIQNLVKNALESTDNNSGIIIISVNRIDKEEHSFVTVSVADNGTGISKDDLPFIFEPKFSTKNKGQESGYGLASVKEKVEEYNGSVHVYSDIKETVFSITLPLYETKMENGKNILLAEDDTFVSEVLSDLLKTQGYNVSIAATGNQAVTEVSKVLFDAMIIDKKMPEMDGIECIKSIRPANPNIPIILASGSDIDLQSDDLKDLNIGWVIKKPYNFPEILSALQKFNL